MPRETPVKPKSYVPVERTGIAQNGKPNVSGTWGDPQYQIQKPDMEQLRKAERTIGDDGIRRVTMTKMGPLADDLALQQYRNDGCEIKDGGHEWLISQPQAQFEELERARHETARRQATSAKAAPVQVGGVKSEAFEDNSSDGSGEVSNKDI